MYESVATVHGYLGAWKNYRLLRYDMKSLSVHVCIHGRVDFGCAI